MKNEKITDRDENFALWYTDVVKVARLANYSNVKGCIVIEPNGYAIWERMQSVLDKMFKETGHRNVSMPLLIPEQLLNKEGELVKGFAPEVAWVTEGGSKKLDSRMCVRPTSETLFSDYYSSILTSYRELPIKYNQWCNVIRWEKETRPFLRSREFLWQEGHTIHATKEEAEKETLDMLNVYKIFFEEYLAIPVLTGKKTEKEKFAGAEYTYTIEALMHNGVALQSGTSHYFGQKFAKAYDISFVDSNNKKEYAYQTSWGVSTRMIGALIMVHSDNYGLVLPPKIAPMCVAIIPIGASDAVKSKANEINELLNKNNITSFIDESDKTPGYKFAQSEVNGIPVRIEIGQRDLDNNSVTFARRDTREKMTESIDTDILDYVKSLLNDIQNSLYSKAKERKEELTFVAHSMDDIRNILNTKPGFIHSSWCGDTKCEEAIKEINGCKSRCIQDLPLVDDKCVCCGKVAKYHVVWGIQY